MEALIRIHAKFLEKGTGDPITGDEFMVKFYDKDVFDDDFLGEDYPDENGEVLILIDPEHAKSWDSPGETKPDLYFVLFEYDRPVYTSRVVEALDVLSEGDFNSVEGASFDFGTFLISV